MPRILIAGLLTCFSSLFAASITVQDDAVVLETNGLERVIRYGDGNIRTVRLAMGGEEMLAAQATEFSVVVTREKDRKAPRPFTAAEAGEKNYFTSGMMARWRSEGFDSSRYDDPRPDGPKWVDGRTLTGSGWGLVGTKAVPTAKVVSKGVYQLEMRSGTTRDGLGVSLFYEVYEGHAAVRKWVVFRNTGREWLRLNSLVIDDVQLAPLTRKPLAAAMFGVQPSVVAFEQAGGRSGLIAASEVPSALRTISDQGAMGYNAGLFEWVLGPGEEFTSEPVFFYGYSGAVRQTAGGASMPLDRTVEGPYLRFVNEQIGVAAAKAPLHGPQWMTWAYFFDRIDDKLVRELAEIAGRAGFTEMLFDDGWQKGRLGTEIDTEKFPDFLATSEHVRKQGMKLGLWVSCFRDAWSKDLRDVPDGKVLPELLRSPSLPGYGMSFASKWRDYYVNDLVAFARKYGVSYFKQDFTDVMYGDVAPGHESRTRRESLLRGLRGLLQAQAMLRAQAPDIVNEITHEIYWGTPGVPADLAALKVTARFHIPPNEAIGTHLAGEFRGRQPSVAEHQAALRRGCWLARQRFYSHRGLPLYPLEFYAAATTNYEGSLTADIQDRQVASWLMGAPVCFSGDLRTLTEKQVAHYRTRMTAVAELEKKYGIYKEYQFSGVPEPTDIDWHWWGKLNAEGEGVVVVVRGSAGAAERVVNVPWVRGEGRYSVRGVFSGRVYGEFTGAALQAGVKVSLPVYGSEVLEVRRGR